MSKHLKKVNHDYLRYANCWEDADLLLAGLDIQDHDRVLSIGSAGDNCFSLLSQNPALIVAVDINDVQLKLIELKKAAFATLNYVEFLEFLGFRKSFKRIALFKKVQKELPPDSSKYWSKHLDKIYKGIIHQGKFERYFALFRKAILPFIHSKKTISKLFAKKTKDEQNLFFQKKWNSLRWKALFKLFFSRFVMGRLGRDPKFLNEVDFSVSDFILGKAKSHLASINCQSNYFLEYICQGKFSTALPHYARPQHFEQIKNNLSRLELFKGYAEQASAQFGKFNKFNLSNVFEYMDVKTFQKTVKDLSQIGLDHARYAYWNLMVPRNMEDVSSLRMTNTSHLNEIQDNGFFYSNFIISQK